MAEPANIKCERCLDTKAFRDGGRTYACDCFLQSNRGKFAVVPGVSSGADVDAAAVVQAKEWLDGLRPGERAAIIVSGHADGRRKLASRIASAASPGHFRFADMRECPVDSYDRGEAHAKWFKRHGKGLGESPLIVLEVSPTLIGYQVRELSMQLADVANTGRIAVVMGNVPESPRLDSESWAVVHEELQRLDVVKVVA